MNCARPRQSRKESVTSLVMRRRKGPGLEKDVDTKQGTFDRVLMDFG